METADCDRLTESQIFVHPLLVAGRSSVQQQAPDFEAGTEDRGLIGQALAVSERSPKPAH